MKKDKENLYLQTEPTQKEKGKLSNYLNEVKRSLSGLKRKIDTDINA